MRRQIALETEIIKEFQAIQASYGNKNAVHPLF